MKKVYLGLILTVALACVPAQADLLTIALDSPTLNGSPGGVLQFSGELTNTSGAILFLNADSLNLAGFDPSAIDDSPFFTNTPLFLAPNGTTGDIGLFNITIPNGFSLGNYPGTFEVLGGATSDDQTIIGSANFTAHVQAPGAVPEPSSFGMFALVVALLVVFGKLAREDAIRSPQ